MNEDVVIQLLIGGDKAKPQLVSASEIADVLKAFEKLVLTTVQQQQLNQDVLSPERIEKQDRIILPLIDLLPGSIDLHFGITDDLIAPAIRTITRSIREQNYTELPTRAVEGLIDLRGIAQRNDYRFALGFINGRREELAEITGDTVINLPPEYKTSSTIHGIVINVGGKREPNLHLELPNGPVIICRFSGERKGMRSRARDAASYLFHWVRLEGIASWSIFDNQLRTFLIESVEPFGTTPLSQGLRNIAAASAVDYSSIDDVDAYTRSLRDD